ncbi:thioredoxin-like protein, partial [Ramicandelaber brevisporus]
MRTTLSLLLAFSTTSCFASLFGSNTNVVPITTSNFRTEVIDTDHPVMLMFGTDWCGYCKKLKPEYVKVAANLRGIVKVGAVDCDDPGSRRVCEIHNIKGFPQVKLFGPERTVSKKTGKDSKKVRDYNGERTAKAIVDFALPNVPSYVEPVKDDLDELETFLGSDGNEVPKVLLLSAKAGTTPLYKGLSIQFNKQLKLGQISKVKADESSI